MKKRILTMLLAMVMIVGILPFAAFADEVCSECGGSNIVVDQTTPGVTCCNAGLVLYKCNDCRHTWPGNGTNGQPHTFVEGECLLSAPADGGNCVHDYKIVKEDAATCTAEGYAWKVCKLCGKEKNGETAIDEDNHINFVDGVCAGCEYVCPHEKTRIDTVSATCAAEGYSKVICELCSKVLSEETLERTNEHLFLPEYKEGKKCQLCDADYQDVCVHDYEIVDEEEGTCTSAGYVWKQCKLCGKETNSATTIDEDNHINFVDGVCAGCEYVCPHEKSRIDTVSATCAAEGYSKVICELCSKVLSEETLERTNEHLFLPEYEEGKKCQLCDAYYQDVCEHDFETVREEIATCCMKGYVWKTCKLCGAEENSETDYNPNIHEGFENGICACGYACPHDMERNDVKYPSCYEDGYSRVVCVKCEKILAETILQKNGEHLFLPEYENGTKCRLCDANLQDVCEHDYEIVREQAGTCIEAGYVWKECKLCGKEYNHETELDPNGHDYNVEKTELPTCEEPGHVWKRCILCAYRTDHDEGEPAGHTFANGKCSVCGDPDPDCPHENHVEDVTQYRAPTCTVDGVRVYVCPACETEQRESIPMLGHNRVESTSAPTCTEDGTRYVNCTRCRTLLDTQIIPATGHNFVGGHCACGASDPTACSHPQNMQSTHTTAATCTRDGYTIVTCDACDDVISRQTHEALGHNFADGYCTRCSALDPDYMCYHTGGRYFEEHEATCTAKGSRIEFCADCDQIVDRETIPAKGHSYVNGICSRCNKKDAAKFTNDFQDVLIVGGTAY